MIFDITELCHIRKIPRVPPEPVFGDWNIRLVCACCGWAQTPQDHRAIWDCCPKCGTRALVERAVRWQQSGVRGEKLGRCEVKLL